MRRTVATNYVYDALNRLVRVTDSLGHVTELAYDNRDNLIAVTDPNGHSWRFEYDRNNRRSKEIKPLGEITLYRYDPADELVELIDAKGQHLIYEYDGSGRLTRERHYTTDPTAAPPVEQIGYAYDAASNLTAWNDGEQSGALVYDALSRLVSETIDYGSFSLTYSYSYHANGLKKSLTYPGGATYTYSYDARNGLAAIEVPGEGSITVNELNWIAPTQVTLPGGTVQKHTFDGLLRPTAQEVTSPAAQRLLAVTSEYGSLRQVLRRDIDGITSQFSYDSELRLLEAVSSDGRQEAYTLDAAANRLTDRASPGSWDYDANNQLLRAGDTVYAYDAAGNVTARTQGIQVTRFFYDVSNRLIRVEDGAGSVIARYGYDPTGRRLWKRTSESITYFLYAQEGLIGEYNAVGQETAAYGWRPDGVWGANPLFYKLGGRVFYAHTDHLGTPLKLTDKAGNVVWAATYSAFGQATISPAATVTYNLRLPGQYFDRETGLHYNWQRYYEVGTGRYLSEDLYPLRGVANQFAYAFANPLYFTDPTGLYPTCRSAILKVRTNAYTDTETSFRYQYEKIVLLPAGVGLTHDLDPRHPRKPPLTLELKVEVALVEITGIDETDFFVHQVFQDLLVSCEETTIDACGQQRTRRDSFTMTIQIENSRTQVGKPRFHERIIKKKTYFEFGI